MVTNETQLGTCPGPKCTQLLSSYLWSPRSFDPFVALACSSYHMSLNVEATTHRMYIGATRVPSPETQTTPIQIFLIPLPIISYSHHRVIMVKLQPHKKIVAQSDSRRQASTLAKQSILPSRDPRTVCMTENDLGILHSSFRANRWPERAEKERLAQLINKYVSLFFFDVRVRLTPRKVL